MRLEPRTPELPVKHFTTEPRYKLTDIMLTRAPHAGANAWLWGAR